MRNRIFLKLMAAFAVVIVAATVTLDVSIRHAWDGSLRQEVERNLRQKTQMLANRVNSVRELSAPSQTTTPQQQWQTISSQEAQASGARATCSSNTSWMAPTRNATCSRPGPAITVVACLTV